MQQIDVETNASDFKNAGYMQIKPGLLFTSFYFIQKHYPLLLGLGLVAAFGKVAQFGGFGKIFALVNTLLEIVVEGSRILIFLFALGMADVHKGATLVKRLFTSGKVWRTFHEAVLKLKRHWPSAAISFLGFALIADAMDFLIDQLAYETSLLLSLKSAGILASAASELTLLLFFKNILVAPFTLVFGTLFLLWVTDNLEQSAGDVRAV